MVAVVIPTIPGRERYLNGSVASYLATCPRARVIVVEGFDNCGAAWNAGASEAHDYDYLHFTADDIEALPGWFEAARALADSGRLAAPLILNTDLSVQSCGGAFGEPIPEDGSPAAFCTVPFLTPAMWAAIGPVPEIHYGTDNYVTMRAHQNGWPAVNCHAYRLVHHLAPEGRDETRMGADLERLHH